MTRSSRSSHLAYALCGLAALVVGMSSARPDDQAANDPAANDQEANDQEADEERGDQVAKFDHVTHADAERVSREVVTQDNCSDCHIGDERGMHALPGAGGSHTTMGRPVCDPARDNVARPGRVTHQPCLASGCHVSDFLATTTRMRDLDPARFQRATAFCAGCHGAGPPPAFAQRPRAKHLFCGKYEPDFHVEMNHLAHTRRAECRDCHVVTADNRLDVTRPNHDECASCHANQDEGAPPMSECGACHRTPAPSEYFKPRDSDSLVRSCGSAEHMEVTRRHGRSPGAEPCFKHETDAHRKTADGEPLQCAQCHYMIAVRKYWSKRVRYRSLFHIKRAPIIDNRRDRAHDKACGGASCHARDVDDSRGGANKCELCHSMS